MIQSGCLIAVPIIHPPADLGSLGRGIPFGKDAESSVTQYWNRVSEYVKNLRVDFSQLRVYQDGLPDRSDDDIACILDSPLSRTPNYDLLRWLKGQGARIVGTEDKGLVTQEAEFSSAIKTAQARMEDLSIAEDKGSEAHERCMEEALRELTQASLRYEKEAPKLSKQRLSYIARRIQETLPEGGTGLLFLGLAHDIGPLLEGKIRIVSPPEWLLGPSLEALRARCGAERL